MQASCVRILLLLAVCHHATSEPLAKLQASTRILMNTSSGDSPHIFDGIGAISGGGATSKLLMNYPSKQREEILDLLFKPQYLGSLQILKVEIGGDSQSTDGTEASHMHTEDDLNLNRGYEWWLMKEAKKRNPKIRLYGLPWVFPGWLGAGTMNPYANNSRNILRYVVEWIQGAKRVHGLEIDYIGIWNERSWSSDYIKSLRTLLDKYGLSSTRIVAADGSLNSIENAVVADPALAKAIDVLGYHYPGAKATHNATASGKKLWCSEEYSAYNDLSGGGCWARILTESFVDAGYTAFIAWNLITSYYDGLPYTRSSLMTANQPWSGWYDIASPIRVTPHFTHFMDIGWIYLPVGSGSGHLAGGGSYVSLVSPTGGDLTIVIQTMDPNKAGCFYGMPKFNVSSEQSVTLYLPQAFLLIKSLHFWRSDFDFVGNKTQLFVQMPDLQVVDGKVALKIASNTLITLSTVDSNKTTLPAPPPSTDFPLLYTDDFESYAPSSEPFLIAAQAGTLEVHKVGSRPGQVIAQMVTQPPIDTCLPTRMPRPIALVGNVKWADVHLTIDVSIPKWANSSSGVFVGVRLGTGGCDSQKAKGIFLWLLVDRNEVVLSADANMTSILEKMYHPLEYDRWYSLSLLTETASDSSAVEAMIDGSVVLKMNLPSDISAAGWVTLGASEFGIVFFDNIAVKAKQSFK